MFSFNFKESTELNFEYCENVKTTNQDLFTKAHLGPSPLNSLSDRSDNDLNCSFDCYSESNHSEIIWNEALNFLQQVFHKNNI
jgi:hypothetical protein